MITKLKNDFDNFVTNQVGICSIVKDYFVNLFGQSDMIQEENMNQTEGIITEDQNMKLVADLTFEQFSEAVKQMHPDKSVGPDDLNPVFY